MPASELTSEGTIGISGLVLTALTAADAAGNYFENDGNTLFVVTNGAGVPQTVTIASQVLCNQGSTHNVVQAIPAGETWLFSGFKPARWSDSAGDVQVTYSAVVNLTVGFYKLGG
jgi:hypothetical protein